MMHRVKPFQQITNVLANLVEGIRKKINVCTEQSAFNKPADQDMYTSVVLKSRRKKQ